MGYCIAGNDDYYQRQLEIRDAEWQFKLKWGFAPGLIMKHGFITVIEDPYMAQETQSKRIYQDRVYVKSIYGYLFEQLGGEAWGFIHELVQLRVMLKLKSIKYV